MHYLTSPTIKTLVTLEKAESIGKQGGKSTGDNRDKPEGGQPLADLEPCIPASDQIGTAYGKQ